MCPPGCINAADGSSSCPQLIPPGTNLATRYAVIISFGVYFNGTALDEIASRVGVQANNRATMQRLAQKSSQGSEFDILEDITLVLGNDIKTSRLAGVTL